MQTGNSPKEIFEAYDRGVAYNRSIGLYDTVRQNENFYLGEQWQGLNAPDLDKPVLNFIKRVCSYLSAMLVSDDIAVELRPMTAQQSALQNAAVLQRSVMQALEQSRMRIKLRELVRNCIVHGDGIFYWYFDAEAEEGRGALQLEVLENTRVLFGNPHLASLQQQPYLLVVRREQAEKVRRRAKRFGGDSEAVRPDSGFGEEAYCDELVTVVSKFYKRDGEVWYTEVCRGGVVRRPVCLGYTLYPLAMMRWDKVRGSYHGRAVITGLIPNQIAVNKLWAMAIRHQQSMAFPKVFYDRLKIRQWTNRVGEAIAVSGNPNEAVASGFRAGDMSAQLMELVERTIRYTKEFMGASDAALGNIEPNNTSAIIAVQSATAAPLELQRFALYQLVEDSVHIMLQLMRAHYGTRSCADESGMPQQFDYSSAPLGALQLTVEVGPAAYWSQLTRMGTLDNLLEKGVLEDTLLYLQSVPEGYIPNKRAIMQSIEKRRKEVRELGALPDM